MLTSSRLFLIGGTLLCAAAFARCGNTPSSTTMDMAGAVDMATTPIPPTLALTAVSPANAVNTGGGMMTLTGTNFLPGATVTIGGVAATNVNVVSTTQITCTIPAKAASCGPAAIVVTNTDSKTVSSPTLFTYRTAALTFSAATAQAMATTTRYVIAVDVDKDGDLDLVSANSGAGNLTVRLNNGNGTFAAATIVALGGMSPYSVGAGDFNADGKVDLIGVLNNGNYIKVRLGDGAGGFSVPTGDPTYSTGAGPIDIAIGDVNGDQKLDVVVVNNGSNSLSTLLGNNDGTFLAATSTVVGMGPVAVILANFNNDGKLDVATADRTTGQATVKLNAANGTGAFGAGSLILGVNSPTDLVAGDFNGDSILDLAVANSTTATIRVTIGVGDSTFNPAQGSTPTAGTTSASLRSIATGDFNLDGLLDIAVTSQADRNVSILLGQGTGAFMPKQDFTLGATADPTQLTVADLNKDGIPDIISTDQTNNGVTVLLSQCL